jgi:hypothetical protein
VDEGVVERGVDVRHSEHLDALADLRAEGHLHLLGLLLLSLAGGHLLCEGSKHGDADKGCKCKQSRLK